MPEGTISEEARFGFGENWRRFLDVLDDERIRVVEDSLKTMLGVDSLANKTFLDIGSGNGTRDMHSSLRSAKSCV